MPSRKLGRGYIFLQAPSIKGGAELHMRSWITAQFSLDYCRFGAMKKRMKVIFLLCLLGQPGKVLFTEQSTGTHPLRIPPASSDPCGIVDISTSQKPDAQSHLFSQLSPVIIALLSVPVLLV